MDNDNDEKAVEQIRALLENTKEILQSGKLPTQKETIKHFKKQSGPSDGNMSFSRPKMDVNKRIDKIIREHNNEYIESWKTTNKKLRLGGDIKKEIDSHKKQLNALELKKRDEVLLRLQKENQEIELELKELKNNDKAELLAKEEESKALLQELNVLYNDKKKEVEEKDKERLAAIEEIRQIQKQRDEVEKRIAKAKQSELELEKTKSELEEKVKAFEKHKNYIENVLENHDEFNKDYEKLKEKFENLMIHMENIETDIEAQKSKIESIVKEQNNLQKKNDKQNQSHKLNELEDETKKLIGENKTLEKEIEDLLRKKQKKERRKR